MATQALSGYFDSPWPCEDAGPARLQSPHAAKGLDIKANERLHSTSRRTHLSTMTVLGAPGEVFLLTHSVLGAHLGLATTAQVQLIDPITLATRCQSPRLAGGPMWPGGMAVLGNGHVLVLYGRYAHLLNRQCELLRSKQLPINEPYNSFVVLANGLVVTKNISPTTPARLSVLHPDTLEQAAPCIDCEEPAIARLSAQGNTVYMVGITCVVRYHWDEANSSLVKDPTWSYHYLKDSKQSYGWDMVITAHDAWFMDNGKHNYLISMLGAGKNKAPNRLHRVSLSDSNSHQHWEVSSVQGGAITNPPLVDEARQIVVAFDSANRHLRAWRIIRNTSQDGCVALQDLWHLTQFGAASHMLLFADTGELCVNDYRRFNEQVVILDIETGLEKSRTSTGGLMQGVVFPSAGWQRDIYWSSMDRLTRIHIAPHV
mgnify:FL=1|jgi:hypothetical protein